MSKVNQSVFSFLFSEIVLFHMDQPDLEQSLKEFAKPIGERVLELCSYRERKSSFRSSGGKRETSIVNVLHFISNQVWKCLFGKMADGLEQSNQDKDEYWLNDRDPVTNIYASSHNCAAFIAGIIEGILFAIDFPACVNAHFSEEEKNLVIYQIKFT